MKSTPPKMLGIRIDTLSLESATQQAMSAIDGSRGQVAFACANPHSLVVAQDDAHFYSALNDNDLVVADGAGIMLAGRLAGAGIGPRIAGAEYFISVMNALQARGGGRVFFFGSSDYVLDRIASRLHNEYPAIELCGTLSPPYRLWDENENASMVSKINGANPDVLWVGITAPKQEKWVFDNRKSLRASVIGSIGAVFDFYAGTHPRAPEWMCKLGLEWLYRLIREPRRMWKRNFISTPKFLYLVFVQHILKIRHKTPSA